MGVPVHSSETPSFAYAAMSVRADLNGADLGRRPVAVPLDDPALVVGLLERDERQAQLLDGVETPDPEQVFLQHPDEALGAAVAFGLADEGRRAMRCRGSGSRPGSGRRHTEQP